MRKKVLLGSIFIFGLSIISYGQIWTGAKRLTWTTGSSCSPSIAVWENNIHIVWSDETTGNCEVYYKKSTDSGVTWTGVKRLTWSDGTSGALSIAVWENNIHVVWHEHYYGGWTDIYYKKSTDNGSSWTENRKFTWKYKGSFPSIANLENNIHIVWYGDGEENIYYKKSTDNGVTWFGVKRLTWPGRSSHPSIDVSGNNVHISWHSNISGYYDIYYKKSTDNGVSWSLIKRLTWIEYGSDIPSIIASGNNIHLTWSEYIPGLPEAYYKKSIDNGETWTGAKRLTWLSGTSYHPQIAVSATNIHVVWYDDSPGNYEIYYKKAIQ